MNGTKQRTDSSSRVSLCRRTKGRRRDSTRGPADVNAFTSVAARRFGHFGRKSMSGICICLVVSVRFYVRVMCGVSRYAIFASLILRMGVVICHLERVALV